MGRYTMENNKNLVRISHITTLIIIGLALASASWIYYSIFIANINTTVPTDSSNIKIDKELYQKIKSSESYGTTVSADEPGYGRVNPFSNYKVETVETSAETSS